MKKFRIALYEGAMMNICNVIDVATVYADDITQVNWAKALNMEKDMKGNFFRLMVKNGVEYIDIGSYSTFVAIWEVK